MDELLVANLVQRPARALASVLGTALGVVLIVVTVGLSRGMISSSVERESAVRAELMFQTPGKFHSGISATPLALPVQFARAIAEVEGVSATTPVGRYIRSGGGGIGFELIEGVSFDAKPGAHAAYGDLTGIKIVEGRAPEGERELVVDRVRLEDQKQRVGDSFELMGHPFRIVGVFEPEVGARVKVPLEVMQRLLGNPGKCSWVLVKVGDPEQQDAVARRIDARFPGHQIIFTRDIPGLYERSIPSLNVFLDVVVALALVISSLVILLAMYTAITERTREIGILRALGLTRGRIVSLIVRESLALSVLGVLVGVALSALARAVIQARTSLVVELDLTLIVQAGVIALIGGGLGGLYPAVKASRRNPVEALAYE